MSSTRAQAFRVNVLRGVTELLGAVARLPVARSRAELVLRVVDYSVARVDIGVFVQLAHCGCSWW